MDGRCMRICMRIALNIDDRLVEEARRLTGVQDKTALVRMGLESLVARERFLRPMRRRRHGS